MLHCNNLKNNPRIMPVILCGDCNFEHVCEKQFLKTDILISVFAMTACAMGNYTNVCQQSECVHVH